MAAKKILGEKRSRERCGRGSRSTLGEGLLPFRSSVSPFRRWSYVRSFIQQTSWSTPRGSSSRARTGSVFAAASPAPSTECDAEYKLS